MVAFLIEKKSTSHKMWNICICNLNFFTSNNNIEDWKLLLFTYVLNTELLSVPNLD